MTDLTSRLRDLVQPGDGQDRILAANCITEIEAEIERLRGEIEATAVLLDAEGNSAFAKVVRNGLKGGE